MDIYVLDKRLQQIGVVDTCSSVIWAERYWEVGDCELYLPATMDAITLLQQDYYLVNPESDMVCQIKRIEITTSAEDGNFLTVTGYDVKRWLDQRIIWGTLTSNGSAEWFARVMVNRALGVPLDLDRQMVDPDGNRIFYLGAAAGFTDPLTEQASYVNVGEKMRELCRKFLWGYKVVLYNGAFRLRLYKGADRSAEVIFSDAFENLSSTDYSHDASLIENVALVAGEGQGPRRVVQTAGVATGVDRFEIYVDARDLSKEITYADLLETYPLIADGGTGYIHQIGGAYWYAVQTLDIQVMDAAQLADLQSAYPAGAVVTIDGVDYYRLTDIDIALLPSATPAADDTVTLQDVVYKPYLINRGYQEIAEYREETLFEGEISNSSFIYGEDYSLGDLVLVQSAYGITEKVRITEVVRVADENGYSVQPKFELLGE